MSDEHPRKKLSSITGRFITKITDDDGMWVFHDARKQPMFRVNPEELYDPDGWNFEDDIS